MILLDTCTLLWCTSEPDRISEEAQKLIRQYSGDLYISSISAFEIGVKSKKGLLKLPLKTSQWFEAALQHHGISEISINSEIAIRSTELPPFHRDPCDRMIIATSQVHDFILLTPDPLIKQYDVKVVW